MTGDPRETAGDQSQGAASPSDAGGAEFGGISVLTRLQILDELARYSWAFDTGDLREYLARFHDDATFQHPLDDGTPWVAQGVEEIAAFVGQNFADRPTQTFGFQHIFNAPVLEREGESIRVRAYVCVLRHEFHRTLWPQGPSRRQGTWHAEYARGPGGWRLSGLDIRMWAGTAFTMGTDVEVGKQHLGAYGDYQTVETGAG